jgi:hypothetical protein
MLRDILSAFTKFFTRDKIIIFIALIILSYALFAYNGAKGLIQDTMADGSEKQPSSKETSAQHIVEPPAGIAGTGYTAQPVANPADLLPADQNSQWASLNPVGGNNGQAMPDLLQAGYHIGLDTIGQTLRNANYQLRADPYIPKRDIGPWNQSTIETDVAPGVDIGMGTRGV